LTAQVFAQSGAPPGPAIMFERQVLGEDYWAKQAATIRTLSLGAPMSDAMVRGEIGMGPLIYNAVYPKQKEGAPLKVVFRRRACPPIPMRRESRRPLPMSMQQAVPELVPVEGGPDLHDQGAG